MVLWKIYFLNKASQYSGNFIGFGSIVINPKSDQIILISVNLFYPSILKHTHSIIYYKTPCLLHYVGNKDTISGDKRRTEEDEAVTVLECWRDYNQSTSIYWVSVRLLNRGKCYDRSIIAVCGIHTGWGVKL